MRNGIPVELICAIVEYDVGKVIGTDEIGRPTTFIKINVRNEIIYTAFHWYIKSMSNELLDTFLNQELDDGVRNIISDTLRERCKIGSKIEVRSLEFNCFNINLDFEKGIITLEDVLSTGPNSIEKIPIRVFLEACGVL